MSKTSCAFTSETHKPWLERHLETTQSSSNSMIAPQDCDVRQSGRVLELQNTDLWIRPTGLSWHFSILVTIRGMPFRNCRGRSSEKLKAREDKIEEAKKQKTLKNRDEDWDSARWKQSSWTWTTSSSSSAWREWSSDKTRGRSDWQSPADWSRGRKRERTDWQLADWEDSSDQVRKATAWQSHYSWQ